VAEPGFASWGDGFLGTQSGQDIKVKKRKGSPYSFTERRVPGLIPVLGSQPAVEHSNWRFESIRFDSICESIRINSFSKKSAFRFTSCHAVCFLFIYCTVSAKKIS